MIYLSLFLEFLKIGCFSFGGGYAAIPMIRDSVLSRGWMTNDQFMNMLAVSESTPGPILINMATYAGVEQGGVLGGVLATVAAVLPAFAVVLLIMSVLKNALKSECSQAALSGVKSCVAGIVAATGAYMIFKNAVPAGAPDFRAVAVTAVLVLAALAVKKIRGKELSSISLVIFSAAVGIVAYGI